MSGNSPINSVQANGVGVILDGQLNAYVQVSADVTALRTFPAISGMAVFLTGTASAGDGGAGLFYWATGTYTDDAGVTTVVPYGNPGGAWLRDPTLVSPNATFTSITTTGTVTVGTTLTVEGNESVVGTLDVGGAIVATGEISTNGSMYVGGALGVESGANIVGALAVTGDVNFGATLGVGQALNVGGAVNITGTLLTSSGAFFTAGAVTVGVHEATEFEISTTMVTWTSGTGAPSSVQPVASLYSRADGTTGSRLYVSAGAGSWNAVSGV